MNEIVVVERKVDSPVDPDIMHRAEAAVGWCFEQYRVAFRYAFVGVDHCRCTSVYEAPDVESLRIVQRSAGLPVDRAWRATLSGEPIAPARGQSLVVALHAASATLDAPAIAARLADAAPGLAARGIAPMVQAVACDGSRWLGVFAAPDLDAVASACAALDLPATHYLAELRLPHP
jgi:hypothetical protein